MDGWREPAGRARDLAGLGSDRIERRRRRERDGGEREEAER
jgi:hypothetical protein